MRYDTDKPEGKRDQHHGQSQEQCDDPEKGNVAVVG